MPALGKKLDQTQQLSWGFYAALFCILFLATWLRTYLVAVPSYWFDESSSWKTIQFDWDEMLTSISRNLHPPFYYVALKAWSIPFGDGPASLRLFSNGKAWLFWSNSVSSFLQFDQDQNGSITAQELKDHAKSYQKRICEPAIAAFDVNGDGELNFQEFRLSLIPNPYDQFSQRPKDINEDGRLSIEELSTNYPGVPKLYAALVFQHLDLNDDQFLGTEEFDYKFRVQDLPAEDAFALIDRDASGEIALNETMQYAQIAHGIDKNDSGANRRLLRR